MTSVSHALARRLPGHALGLGQPGLTAEAARDRLAAIGDDDPEVGHGLADEVMRAALRLIADGHPAPQELARYALTIDSAEFPRWYA